MIYFCYKNSSKLEFLDLSHNNLGEASGKLLGPAISENTSIKHLDLSWNNFRRKGAIAIAKGLQVCFLM
jgi:Ran GTPase-activating protein (RanGAP) involved in mRNA processing and transport